MADKRGNGRKSVAAGVRNFMSDLWTVPAAGEKSARRVLIVAVRIIVAIATGIVKKRVLVQASSLSYATLLAVGPILAITIMFSQIFYKDKDETFVYDKIMDAATFVMPAFNEMIKEDSAEDVAQGAQGPQWLPAQGASGQVSQSGGVGQNKSAGQVQSGTAQSGQGDGTKAASGAKVSNGAAVAESGKSGSANAKAEHGIKVNPRIYEFIENISRGSAKAGIFGVIAMLLTCLLLLINMENAFNYIWGVSVGRNWLNRVVFYFVMIFFGSVGAIFSAGFFATSTLASMFGDIPVVRDFLPWLSYCFGVAVMLIVLSCFYKFIPSAKVEWRAALVGASVVTVLLLLNNKGSFLYISYIAKQQSFYGYLAIVAVVMFSLYIFWTLLLSGGMIAYAVQFVGFFDDDQAWNKIGSRAKRMCALAVFSEVSKDFCSRGRGSCDLDSISNKLKLPKVVVSMCVKWLVQKDLVCWVDSPDGNSILIKPSVSPDSITVAEFFEMLEENGGDRSVVERLSGYESSVRATLSAIADMSDHEILGKKIKDIMY